MRLYIQAKCTCISELIKCINNCTDSLNKEPGELSSTWNPQRLLTQFQTGYFYITLNRLGSEERYWGRLRELPGRWRQDSTPRSEISLRYIPHWWPSFCKDGVLRYIPHWWPSTTPSLQLLISHLYKHSSILEWVQVMTKMFADDSKA